MLRKIFIKDYANIEDKQIRNKYGIIAGTIGIITNLLLGIIKITIGLLSNSISIMADAINNIADTLSSILTIIGFRLANKKPNQKHPYGYARYEYIAGFLIAIFMILTGLILAKESIIKIIYPSNIIINKITYIILLIAIFGKTLQMIMYINFSKIIKSKTLDTNVIDSRNDIISTTSILLSMIIMSKFHINIDGILGLIISIFLIYSSINIAKEVLEPIIGIKPNEERVKEIENKLLSYEYVKGIHDLVLHNYGVQNDYVTVHIEIDSNMNILEAHDLMDIIENDFMNDLGINITIHMDPVVIGDETVDKIKNKIIRQLKKLDKDITIHDFRIIEEKEFTNIFFDCVISYEKDHTSEEIKNYLQENIKSKKTNYNYFIEIDRPYC